MEAKMTPTCQDARIKAGVLASCFRIFKSAIYPHTKEVLAPYINTLNNNNLGRAKGFGTLQDARSPEVLAPCQDATCQKSGGFGTLATFSACRQSRIGHPKTRRGCWQALFIKWKTWRHGVMDNREG